MKEYIFAFAGLAAVFVVMASVAHCVSWYECERYSTLTGRETRTEAIGACYVKHGHVWLRWDEHLAVLSRRPVVDARP